MWLCCCNPDIEEPERVTVARYKKDGTLVWRNLPYEPGVDIVTTTLTVDDGVIIAACEDNSGSGFFVTWTRGGATTPTEVGITKFKSNGVREWVVTNVGTGNFGSMTTDSSGDLYILTNQSGQARKLIKRDGSDGSVIFTKTTSTLSYLDLALEVRYVQGTIYIFGKSDPSDTYCGITVTTAGAKDDDFFPGGGGTSAGIRSLHDIHVTSGGEVLGLGSGPGGDNKIYLAKIDSGGTLEWNLSQGTAASAYTYPLRLVVPGTDIDSEVDVASEVDSSPGASGTFLSTVDDDLTDGNAVYTEYYGAGAEGLYSHSPIWDGSNICCISSLNFAFDVPQDMHLTVLDRSDSSFDNYVIGGSYASGEGFVVPRLRPAQEDDPSVGSIAAFGGLLPGPAGDVFCLSGEAVTTTTW